jgi:hypothetical protein
MKLPAQHPVLHFQAYALTATPNHPRIEVQTALDADQVAAVTCASRAKNKK